MQHKIEALNLKIKELEEENRLKTHWISLISHDTKELFLSIQIIIDALEDKLISQEDFFKMLPEIKQNAKKNLQSVSDTGDWIKTQYGQFQPNLEDFFIFDFFLTLKKENEQKLKDKGISFLYKGNETVQLHKDIFLCFFIFNKILNNAIKYSNSGQLIDFQVIEHESEISISIIDQGFGMNEKTLKNIFTFGAATFTGTSGERGSGLSLKIVKEFINLINGKIKITSKDKEGTTVTVKFSKVQT